MTLIADVTLNSETLAAISVIIGGLWTALIMLWRADAARREAEKADLRQQRSDMFRVIVEKGLLRHIPERTRRKIAPEDGASDAPRSGSDRTNWSGG